ncbi:hypothetical protein WDU94_009851 [Cyamophila willieti]
MRCHRILGYVFRNSKGLSSEAFLLLYKALVRSLIEYCCLVWSPHYEVHCHALERVQKRFLSYFSFRYPQECSSSLIPLSQRRKELDGNFFEKIIDGHVDCSKLLELEKFDCSRRLRSNKTFFVPNCRTNYLYFAPLNRMMRDANVNC